MKKGTVDQQFLRLAMRMTYVDDIVLSEGRLGASVPGAAIGGVLGAQTGSGGANGVSAWDPYYYHYNDLGTVLATTDMDGDLLGVYEPDHFGNYRFVYGTKPDSMGLTGKFFDTSAGLYYFNARWLDPERGRWMGKDPLGYIDSFNLYQFVNSNPLRYADIDGKSICGAILIGYGVGQITNSSINATASAMNSVHQKRECEEAKTTTDHWYRRCVDEGIAHACYLFDKAIAEERQICGEARVSLAGTAVAVNNAANTVVSPSPGSKWTSGRLSLPKPVKLPPSGRACESLPINPTGKPSGPPPWPNSCEFNFPDSM